jgi:hypothetical protein
MRSAWVIRSEVAANVASRWSPANLRESIDSLRYVAAHHRNPLWYRIDLG